MWPFNKKIPVASPMVNDRREDDNLTVIPMEKSFDWAHYQAIAHGGISAAYQDEYDFQPTIRVLKSLYAREPWVAFPVNAISRQFLHSRHVLAFKATPEGDEQLIYQHPMLSYLSTAGKENPSFFTSNNIIDLLLTGNAYVWMSKDLRDKTRLPSERVDMRFSNGQLQSYQVTNPNADPSGFSGGGTLELLPEEVIHFMLPNPYSSHVGMSLFMAIHLPVLIDKYGREFIVGFFMRGGHTSAIIETEATNADQLTRFVKSIMQAIGGRRNTHADKVLPKGARLAGSAAKFSEITLNEILKDNQTMFRAATGCTNTILGIADGVNRATAMAEMEHFWKMTILPLQYMYCSAIKHSSLWWRFGLDDRYELRFDNSRIEYLDDFSRKLDEDIKLKPVLTVNERRMRLGFDLIPRIEDKFESEMTVAPAAVPFTFALPQESVETKELFGEIQEEKKNELEELVKIKSELPALQDPAGRPEGYFQREFGRWEDIVLANLKSVSKAKQIISNRSKPFSEGLNNILIKDVSNVYDYHISRLKKSKSYKRVKDENTQRDRESKLQDLKERAMLVLSGEILKNNETSFSGYSEQNMQPIYDLIENSLREGMSLDDVASEVRKKFSEFYEGQAKTIVRTEFACAMALSNYRFGSDLATITKKTRKKWITMDDIHSRPKHLALDGKEVVGESEKVPDMRFKIGQQEYLRYPKDPSGNPEDVINCRCDMIWDVVEWE